MMRGLSVLSVFFSALLAFSVEPLIAKRLLPTFGGSAAVWVTCLVTFQGLLLLGYAYAHVLLRLPRKFQIPVHAAVLLLPFLVLPFGTPNPPPPGAEPMGRIVLELLRSAALPFFALSTNSSLVQAWYARREGQEPWFLYAMSNAGSLAGLLGYPLLIEPFVGVSLQSFDWTLGYAAFALLTGVLTWIAAKTDVAPAAPATPRPPTAQVIRWTVRSAIGALLLTSVSGWVTQDVAALPLLWVVPLALYLLTFILAFSSSAPFPRRILAIVCMLFVILGLVTTIGLDDDVALLLFASLGALFFGAWLVHGDLARDRPSTDHLAAYYLWIALGGFLGGVSGNVIAPLVFESIAEFPLALGVLGLAIAAEPDLSAIRATFSKRSSWAIAAAMLALLVGTSLGFRSGVGVFVSGLPVVVLLAGVVLNQRQGIFGAGAALVAVFVAAGALNTTSEIAADRSFYGVSRITESDGLRAYIHGTTLHGLEVLDPPGAPPGAYFHPVGPLGSSMLAFSPTGRIGVIGLGAGALAVLSQPGQTLEYFEIDPAVEPLAREHFSFLRRSPAQPVQVAIGDARLVLQGRPDASYDALLIDAFSSDSIPVHLLTREAMELYFRKLKPSGVLVFHVSNRYFDLRPVIKAGADALDAHALFLAYVPPDELREKEHLFNAKAIAVSRDAATLDPWRAMGWTPLEGDTIEWVDDWSSLVPLLLRGIPDDPPP